VLFWRADLLDENRPLNGWNDTKEGSLDRFMKAEGAFTGGQYGAGGT